MTSPALALARIEALRLSFGPDAARKRLALMRQLGRSTFRDAAALRRWHEVLLFARAYPDDAQALALATRLLRGFAKRADLRRHRDALADSGIAGTDIHYRFFAGQAQWLVQRWPHQLEIDRDACDPAVDARIAHALPSMLPAITLQAMVETKPGGFDALDRLRGLEPARSPALAARPGGASAASQRPGAAARASNTAPTDATVLLRAIASMPGDGFTREAVSDGIDAAYVLRAGTTTPLRTPSRTTSTLAFAPVVFRHAPPPLARPDLRASLTVKPRRVRRLTRAEGRSLADAAQAAMVTRARSLEAFSFANPDDGWLVDDGDGLAFALMGVLPERRHPVAAWIGGLTLRNGVPIGYTQADLTGPTAALSFNTFETFRGAEAAFTFARWLAALHHVFGTTSFSIEPYQLGAGNDEALASGAYWFYAKAGFAPRDADVHALLERERARVRRRPGYRSRLGTLEKLAAAHVHFDLATTWGLPRLAGLGWDAGRRAIDHGGVDAAVRAAQRACGVSPSTLSTAERRAWHALGPVIALAPTARWTPAQRRALATIVAAKAAPSEDRFVRLVCAHEPLMRWLCPPVRQGTSAEPLAAPASRL
jgi:hypothetical protein